MTNQVDTVREILEYLAESYYPEHEYGKQWEEMNNEHINEALQALSTLIENEVIGEDTPRALSYYDEIEQANVYKTDEAGSIRVTKNQLRAEQRAKLQKVMGLVDAGDDSG